MTTDELKKEAEEYAIDNYENCLYDDFHYVNDRRAREEAYIAGAEPREKRIAELEELLINSKRLSDTIEKEQKKHIAELEETIDKLREQLSLRYDLEDKIAELEQENAELKEEKRINKWADLKGGLKVVHKKNLEMYDQLTKAKKLIKQLLDFGLCDRCTERAEEEKTLITEAEQFLKESGVKK